jgi:hypothetical protein
MNFKHDIKLSFAGDVPACVPSLDMPEMWATLTQFSGLFSSNTSGKSYQKAAQFRQSALQLASAISATDSLQPYCHAEIVVLLSAVLLWARPGLGLCNHIGVSKLSCCVCDAFIKAFCRAYNVKFRTSGTHRKLYDWSGLPKALKDSAAGSGDGGDGGNGGNGDGSGDSGDTAFKIAQALRNFDATLLGQIFGDVRAAIADEFARRCQSQYGPATSVCSVAESDSDTSIDGAGSSGISMLADAAREESMKDYFRKLSGPGK